MTDDMQRSAHGEASIGDDDHPGGSTDHRIGSTRKADVAPVIPLPAAALNSGRRPLQYADLKPVDALSVFERLEDLLESKGSIGEDRHTILLKLLLVKLYDEECAQEEANHSMLIQDFSAAAPAHDGAIERIFTDALGNALELYQGVLARAVPRSFNCTAEFLRQVSSTLCGARLRGSAPQAIQDLFMYFGRFHYGVDPSKHFMPGGVIRSIIEIINPHVGERVVDPACGTGDFLAGAKQTAADRHGVDISECLHGYDIAPLAAHLTRFNLLLNATRGTGNIQVRDSLLEALDDEGHYDIALCNPPFSSRVMETRPEALGRFQLVNARKSGLGTTFKTQEVGLLYVENCWRSLAPGGRAGILVPNGYLGNRSERYQTFRRWLFLNVRVAAVIGFPRFAFKKSGADVSASALIFERRPQPLRDLSEADDHPIHFGLIEKVGWDLQSKYASPLYKRDPRTGIELRDAAGERIPDTDFEEARIEVLTSDVVETFPWMDQDVRKKHGTSGWSVRASNILAHADLSLDPKRWCRKHVATVKSVRAAPHLDVGEVIRPVNRTLRKKSGLTYRYVEIEKIYEAFGAYVADDYHGWQLPDRGRLVAAPGDIFIANIWSSAGKWMIAGDDAQDGRLIVTTGCSHFELIPGQEHLLADLVFGLCSEAFKIQMRALAAGSDGLSSIAIADICSIALPRVSTPETRGRIERRIQESRSGQLMLPRVVRDELAAIAPDNNFPPRSSNIVLV